MIKIPVNFGGGFVLIDHLTLGGQIQRCQQRQKGGFSTTRATDEGVKLTRFKLVGDAF